METEAIVGTVVGVVLFVIIVILIAAFFIFKKYIQGKRNKQRRMEKRCKGKDYSSAQSQIRRKDGTIEAVHVKRLTRTFSKTNPASDLPESVTKVNQPEDNGDVFIVNIPPPPDPIRI